MFISQSKDGEENVDQFIMIDQWLRPKRQFLSLLLEFRINRVKFYRLGFISDTLEHLNQIFIGK